MSGRFALIVLDGCGVGGALDAAEFGDESSNTLGNLARERAQAGAPLLVPNLISWGLGHVVDIPARADETGEPPVGVLPLAAYGRMAERAAGKDTTVGHWEMMGVSVSCPFPTFPRGFPPDLVKRVSQAIGFELVGNEVASGTEIVARLGAEAVRNRAMIVYTSADSVFQLAAHEDVIPVDELYQACETARALLVGENGVGRVIARPFVGTAGAYVRTAGRRDFSMPPPKPTVLDALKDAGVAVHGAGKVGEVFTLRGFETSEHTADNVSTAALVTRLLDEVDTGMIFANLGDFDTLWGHRNDVEGFAAGLEAIDRWLPDVEAAAREGDVVVVTADHGCDPTTASTDHSRENVPLLVWRPGRPGGVSLGTREGFYDLGASAADYFGVEWDGAGRSFLRELP